MCVVGKNKILLYKKKKTKLHGKTKQTENLRTQVGKINHITFVSGASA